MTAPFSLVGEWPALSITPVLSLWLLIPGFIALLILSATLYYEQRRIAPRSTVIFLSGIRALILLLVALLFLQPALQWSHARATAGTLWLVVDQSPSMQTPDPQALPGERLHWAEALGLLTEDTRAQRPDLLQAQIHSLAGEIAALKPTAPPNPAQELAVVRDFGKNLDAWTADLDKVIGLAGAARGHLNQLVPAAGTVPAAGDRLVNNLGVISAVIKANAFSAKRASSVAEAQADVDYTVAQQLATIERDLAPAVAAEDAAFLRAHGGDADVAAGNARIASITRHELAQGVLSDSDALATKRMLDLADKYNLRIASFADEAQAAGIGSHIDSAQFRDTLKSALAPAGQSTSLDSALEFVSSQIATDEAASVIIVSDGRNNVGADPTGPANILGKRNVRVYGLLVGSHEVSPDAAIDTVDYPEWVFKGDTVTIHPQVRLDGLNGKTATVELLRDGSVVDRKPLMATGNSMKTPVEFTDKPPESAVAVEYKIRVSEMPGEVNTQNNLSTFRVAIKKDKLYALVIEDRPRWEYRYLATTLARDKRIKIQTVLLAPGIIQGVAPPTPVRASPTNPHDEAQLLPVTPEEWQAFDIIVLGDISPEVLTAPAQQAIAAAVRDKGATLITIAGQRSMPQKFSDSALAEILPVTLASQWTTESVSRHTLAGFRVERSVAAGASGLIQFDSDLAANNRLWQGVPLWYWHSAFTQVKPAATAIWTIEETGPGGATPAAAAGGPLALANKHALLSSMAVGLGRSLFLASDQTWRLRQVNGSDLHDRFWKQVLAWAVGSDLPAGGKFVRFGASQPSYSQDKPATITARILHEDLSPYTGLSFSAVARPVSSGVASTNPAGTPGAPANITVEARFQPTESPGYYTATLGGLPSGDVEISLKGLEVERLLDNDPTVTQRTLLIRVEPTQNFERKNMNTDPATLDSIAHAGDGYSLDAPYADLLLSRLPLIQHTETITSQLGFFTDPKASGTHTAHWSFLAIFALLLTTEWILRKRAGLV